MHKCLIVENSFKAQAESLGTEIKSFLEGKGFAVEVFSYDGRKGGVKSKAEFDFNGFEFAVSLGGDGTVLFVARGCAQLGIPVFAVNLGEFGFVAGSSKNSWQKDMQVFLDGNSIISERSLVSCEVIRESRTVFSCASMNDCVITGRASSCIVNLEVAYNRAVLGPFKTTGIIVSTPTGSTAFSAAAGGPIVDPSMTAMILTPISSFSLSARPLVFGQKGEIAVTVLPSRCDVLLSSDGQIDFELKEGDVVILGIPEYKARLINATQEKFYSALQSKLNWSGGPRA